MVIHTLYSRLRITLSLVILLLTAASAGAEPADDLYAVAANHYRYGRWQQATDAFTEFLAQVPAGNPIHARYEGVRFFLGESLVQLGRREEARKQFTQLLADEPDNRYARQAEFRLGEIAYLGGQTDEAHTRLEKFVQHHPQHALNAFALCYLGDLALAAKQPAEARRYYSQSMADFPDSAMRDACRFGLARALEESGDVNEALRFYKFLVEPPADAAGKVSPPSDLADDAQLQLALMLHHAQRWDEALAESQAFLELFPESEWLPHARYWRAMTLARLERHEDAAQEFEALAQAFPEHDLAAAIQFHAGEQLRTLGKTVEAANYYRTVYTRWPESEWADDSLQAHLALARGTANVQEVLALAAQFDRQHADSPLGREVAEATGQALLKAGRTDEAIEVFQRQVAELEHLPADAQRRDRLHYFLALAYLQAQRHPEALAVLKLFEPEGEQRFSSAQLQEGLLEARAAALMGTERFAESVPVLDRLLARSLSPEDRSQCLAQKAVALTHLGRWPEASTALDTLLKAGTPPADYVPATVLFVAESAYAATDYTTAEKWFTWLADAAQATARKIPQETQQRALAGLAWTQFKRDGSGTASAETFQRLLTDHPHSPLAAEAAFMRAKALEERGDVSAALASYLDVANDHGDSPYLRPALAQAARLYDSLQQDEQALQLLDRLLEEYGDQPQVADYLYQKAWVLVDLERGEEADRVFATLATRFPQSGYWADATYRLAERAARANQWDDANRLTQQLVQSEPSAEILTYALYLQGQLAASQKLWDQVKPPLDRLVTEFPENPLRLPAEFWIAESQYRLGRFDEAAVRFDRLSQAIEGRNDSWLAMIPLRRAQVLAQKNAWSEAYELAQPIRSRYPNFRQQYEVDYLLGRCLASAARFEDARAAYERVVQSPIGGRTETAAMAQWMIGESYFHQKQYREALQAYHRVESLYDYPRWQAAALLQAGKCYELADRWQEAIMLYQQILQRFADTEFATPARQRLKEAESRPAVAASSRPTSASSR